jgi:hypothetical protein
LRNTGSGIAVLQSWHTRRGDPGASTEPAPVQQHRRQHRDLYVPAGGVSFWQAALRPGDGERYAEMRDTISEPHMFFVDLLYSDHEGGQRVISRFNVIPRDNDGWLCSVVRHWNLDRAGPR